MNLGLDASVAIFVSREFAKKNLITDFMYSIADRPNHFCLSFGTPSLLHRACDKLANVKPVYKQESDAIIFSLVPTRTVVAGEMLLRRDLSKNCSEIAVTSAQQCLSNVVIDKSKIMNAGMGVFATRNFKKGDIVYVSPFLVLPLDKVWEEGGELINYCITTDDSEQAILPLGHAAVINHNSTPNVALECAECVNSSTLLLNGSIVYRAIQEISFGSEFSLNYGDKWVKNYRNHEKSDLTLFRHPILAPVGFFPKSIKYAGSLAISITQH
jgi:hypothetical protein